MIRTLICTTALLTAVSAAHAQRGMTEDKLMERAGERFENMDENSDGSLSMAEYQSAREAGFDQRDTNGDGVIDEGETPRGRRGMDDAVAAGRSKDEFLARANERFSELDADEDGQVSLDEYEQAWSEAFARADSNGDGVLRRGEMRDLQNQG
jgi:Ca2+-binding EF-hand superfamily protein